MKKIFFALAALVLAFTECSQEEDAIQVSEKKAVKVVVNMDKPGFGTDARAARKGWEDGDNVAVVLNDDFDKIFFLTYSKSTSEWTSELFFYIEDYGYYGYIDEDDDSNPGPNQIAAQEEYLSSLSSGSLKAIYCSSGISHAAPNPEGAATDAELTGVNIVSFASVDKLGECIMTCDEGDNGTYSVSEGVLTLDITMKPRVAQYTIRDLNIEDGWNISIHGPVNGYAGGIITPDGIDLTLIEDVLYGYPHQNGNDISIFAAPWQSNEDIPDFMLEELPDDFEMPENMYQMPLYDFSVQTEEKMFGREFDYKEVKIGGAVIFDGPYTEDADGNKTTGAQEWI